MHPSTECHTQIAITTGGLRAIDWLAQHTPLSRMQIKKAMTHGAVWWQQGKRRERLRRATRALPAGGQLHLHYDAAILALIPPTPTLIADEKQYSVWHKPAGLLAQGTLQGDHCSLLRLVELQLQRPVFLVHRLDREANGLMLVAHTTKAAAALSALFQRRESMEKHYRATVQGHVCASPLPLRIDTPLDGKDALTWVDAVTPHDDGSSTLLLRIDTGRKHQIRRHLAGLGHPVCGDVRYGATAVTARATLMLTAYRLVFRCPFSHAARDYCLPDALLPTRQEHVQ